MVPNGSVFQCLPNEPSVRQGAGAVCESSMCVCVCVCVRAAGVHLRWHHSETAYCLRNGVIRWRGAEQSRAEQRSDGSVCLALGNLEASKNVIIINVAQMHW